MKRLTLLAPLAGWAGPLDEVDDAVFAARMLGDGMAIDPTEGILRAPCEGEVTALPESAHAVTLRASIGAEVLLHVGIDTVALQGEGFSAEVAVGQRVAAGQALIRFDLERVARGARSLQTPVIVTEPERFRIVERRAPGSLRAGDVLMALELIETGPSVAVAAGEIVSAMVRVTPEHGLHARPAALLAQSLRKLRAEVTLSLRGRRANARSAVALLALGARHGDVLDLEAHGDDAALVPAALEQALARATVNSTTNVPAVEPDAGDRPRGGALVAAPGLAIGPAVRILRGEPTVPEHGAGAEVEMRRFDEARARLGDRLRKLSLVEGEVRAGIVAAHLEFLEDPELLAAAYRSIAKGRSAGWAWRDAVDGAIRLLGSLEDGHLAARADDLRDLELQLLELIAGAAPPVAPALPAGAILIARDLLPSQFLALDAARIGGICTVSRAATSHVAILAGAHGLPMLAGVDAALLALPEGTTVLVDAEHGIVSVAPRAAEIADAESRIAIRARDRALLRTAAALDGRTADGQRIEVFANVGSRAEAAAAVASGAEGCGLLRTEFLFLDRERGAERGRAGTALPGNRRRFRHPPRGHPHARCGQRQVDSLPRDAGTGQPGAGFARYPCQPLASRAAARATRRHSLRPAARALPYPAADGQRRRGGRDGPPARA